MRRPILAASLFVSLAVVPAAVLAQPAPAAEDTARVDEARNQYRAGVAAFSRGRYPEATLAFERSYHLRPHPVTLYNAAEARFRAGDPQGALLQLRELLAMTSPAPDPEQVTRTRALAEQMGEHNLQPAPAHETPSCPECPPPPVQHECPPPLPAVHVATSINPLAWVLAGGALALVGVGGGFFALASDYSHVYMDPASSRDLQVHLASDGGTYTAVGVTLIVAGLASAAGATYLFMHPRETSSGPPMAARRPRWDFAVSPTGVAVGGTF